MFEDRDDTPDDDAPETENAAPEAVEPSEPTYEPAEQGPRWVDDEIAELDSKNVEDLNRRASERGVVGYSGMNKPELVQAIAKSLRDNPPPEPRI